MEKFIKYRNTLHKLHDDLFNKVYYELSIFNYDYVENFINESVILLERKL